MAWATWAAAPGGTLGLPAHTKLQGSLSQQSTTRYVHERREQCAQAAQSSTVKVPRGHPRTPSAPRSPVQAESSTPDTREGPRQPEVAAYRTQAASASSKGTSTGEPPRARAPASSHSQPHDTQQRGHHEPVTQQRHQQHQQQQHQSQSQHQRSRQHEREPEPQTVQPARLILRPQSARTHRREARPVSATTARATAADQHRSSRQEAPLRPQTPRTHSVTDPLPLEAALSQMSLATACGLRPSTAAPLGLLLQDDSDDRMFKQMTRSGILRSAAPDVLTLSPRSRDGYTGRQGSARLGGRDTLPDPAQAARAALARAEVAARARELLSALAAGSTAEQLRHLTSTDYAAAGTTPRRPQSAVTARSAASQGTASAARQQEFTQQGSWMPSVEIEARQEPVPLSQVELSTQAEARLQRCCVWVVNRSPEPCCICLDTMHLEESVVMLHCGHRLHRPCVKKHIMAQRVGVNPCCPICRTPLE